VNPLAGLIAFFCLGGCALMTIPALLTDFAGGAASEVGSIVTQHEFDCWAAYGTPEQAEKCKGL
jgi:hypothetical protein